MSLKIIISIVAGCVSFVWDVILTILLIVHKIKHTDPAKKSAAKLEKQSKKSKLKIDKMMERVNKLEKKLHVEVKND